MVDRDEMQRIIREETQSAVKAAIIGAAEMERRKKKKEIRKKVFKFIHKCICIAGLIGIGYMIGVHREVVIEYVDKHGKNIKIPKCLTKCPCKKK